MSVRTTLTLDDDVAVKLKDEARRSGRSFKETVNTHLRRSLASADQTEVKPFRVKPQELRPRMPLNYDNIGELVEQAEGPWHK